MLETKLQEAFKIAKELDIEIPLMESMSYYNLRVFINNLIKSVKNDTTKIVLKDILKTLAKLEVMNEPIISITKITNKKV